MSNSLNKVTLIGNIGQDPEIRTTKEGKEIATFNIATTESWKDRSTGEKNEKTEWHKVVIFNEGLVGIIREYVKKGSKVYLEGSLQTRKWTDNNGQEKYTTEVVLQGFGSHFIILDNKRSSDYLNPSESRNSGINNFDNNFSNKSTNNNFKSNNFINNDDIDDEIPF